MLRYLIIYNRQKSLPVTADRYGAGLSTYNQFDTALASGSFWGQRSSRDGALYGGVGVASTLAVGQGDAILSRHAPHHQGGGMIINVISDDKDAELVAYHRSGSTPLKPGSNFVPVSAWQPGSLQIDFPGNDVLPLKAWPQYLNYHHVRGGVSSHDIRVMKTVTVMGRVVDIRGKPLAGAHVINHAGRTVTESDGLFTLELHEKNPVVSIDHHSGLKCEISFNPSQHKREEILFAGNVTCAETARTEKRPLNNPTAG